MQLNAAADQKKLLLHLKCLLWCLHQMQTRYDINLVLYSLERDVIHPEIRDSNLGDNLAYLLNYLEPGDRARLGEAIRRLPDTMGSIEVGDKRFELGHYVQSVHDFGPIKTDTYGVITSITPQLRALFYLEGGQLLESSFAPSDARVIFGTYIV